MTPPAAPPKSPITSRMVAALAQLRAARENGDGVRELAWLDILDGLLDRYLNGER